jgi:amino acid adenylation domain-containing protein
MSKSSQNIESVYLLSPLQEGMLFHTLLAPEEGAYHDHVECRLIARRGLDVPLFHRAFEEVVERHSALRTAFTWKLKNKPHQVVLRRIRLPLESLDWRHLTPPHQEVKIEAFLARDRGEAFDLTRPPLVRLTLIRLEDEVYRLLFSHHHIILDAWSAAVVLQELIGSYLASLQGLPAQIEPPRPFQLYIDWLGQQDPGRSELFWRRYLEGFAAPTPLDYDPAQALQDDDRTGGEHRLELPPELTTRLQELARARGLTLSLLVQATWSLVLSRVSGEADVVHGLVVAGRPPEIAGIESMVGMFTNTLPVRARVDMAARLEDWLRSLQAEQGELHQHQWTPLLQIQKWSEVPSGEALFESVVVFQNTPFDAARLPRAGGDFEVHVVRHDPRNNFPLTLMALPGRSLSFRLIYGARHFHASVAPRRLEFLETLLRALLTAGPAARLGDLPVLTPVEAHQLVVEFNDSALDAGPHRTFLETFAGQVERAPDAIAASFREGRLTYRELDQRSGRFAQALAGRSVGPETIVALLAERGIDFLTGMLGIFKAGGAYLPLDPNHPAERQRQLLEESRTHLVIAVCSFLPMLGEALAGLEAMKRPAVVAIEDLLAPSTPNFLGPARDGEELLAYTIFTSGSTGVPKGVMVHQLGMMNHLLAKVTELGLSASNVVAQNASQCFDISVWQFLAPLVVGGQVRVFEDEVAQDPTLLLNQVEETGISVLETVPSMLRALLNEIARREERRPTLAALSWLIPTGEALSPELCREWLRLYPATRMLNAYGPTECSDDVSHQRIERIPEPGQTHVPIGRPVVNTRLHIVDRELRPLPLGTAGELCAGGVGVGRGYLFQPDRTAEVFVPDPFSDEPGTRLYRTGDLARQLPDGAIVFLGRRDHQVKIRGFRIELGEIEALLGEHSAVGSAVVMARGEESGGRLVAYVVPDLAYQSLAAPDAGGPQALDSWRTIFDEVYNRGSTSACDAGVNLRVWVSSYTGHAFSEEEILESVEDSVARIAALSPRRVLELGCGTGLILFRIVPRCELYYGTDFSREALAAVEGQLDGHPELRPKLTLLQRAAHEIEDLPSGSFDMVILNEIVQYFPRAAYLIEVLERAVERVEPGGFLFIGGLRSFPLLDTFYLSVLLHRAPDAMPVEELRLALQVQREREKELAVDPEFFFALQERSPRIGRVRVQLKGGRARNEFTSFRYDVVLEIEPEASSETKVPWTEWSEGEWRLEGLRHHLEWKAPEVLALSGVPNARVLEDVRALDRLAGFTGSVGELKRAAHDAASAVQALDPAALLQLGDELGYVVQVSWAASGDRAACDVVFARPGAGAAAEHRRVVPPRSWSSYVNALQERTPNADLVPALREHLRRKLPDYMVPASFVFLDALPLSANGKVDRKALLEPGQLETTGEVGGGEARTPTEELLQGIWGEVLKGGTFAVDQPFFEVGGHSLLAIQVLSRIRAAFQVELPLRSIFDAPTIAGLARRVEEAQREGQGMLAPPLVRVPRKLDLPLALAQQRLWILDQLDPESAAYNLPIALRLQGHLDVPVLERTLTEVVRRHEILRTTFRAGERGPVQVISMAAPFHLPVVDLGGLSDAEGEVLRLAFEEPQRSFDLQQGPLIRGCVLHLGRKGQAVLLDLHHIISDFWSMGILVREVTVLYEAFAQGRPSPLPELPVQYADFAHWQHEWLRGEVLERQLAYWKGHLHPPLTALELPDSRQVDGPPGSHGRSLPFRLSPETSRSLIALSRQSGVTLFMVLLGIFKTLLFRRTGQTDLIVGTDMANRHWQETEGLIGFFVNLLVLRTRLQGRQTFQELLATVREVVLAAYLHRDLPFDRLVSELKLDRGTGQTPLVDALFVFENAPIQQVEINGLVLSPLGVDQQVARFNLALFMEEGRDGIVGRWNYRTDLFEAAAVERLARQFQVLAESICADPARCLDDLELVSEEERAVQASLQARLQQRSFDKFRRVQPKPSSCERVAGQSEGLPDRGNS